jgi:hypothetical protein
VNHSNSSPVRVTRVGLACFAAIGWMSGLLVSALAWLIPPEVFAGWAVARVSHTDPYAQFEALGIAEAQHWTARWFGLVMAGMCFVLWRQQSRVAPWIEGAGRGFWRVTEGIGPAISGEQASPRLVIAVSTIKRVAILSALLLSLGHWVGAVRQRFQDWPYYRLNDGDQVLPNISDSNRAVIRYLRTATPEHCRIFVVSDQKLFFLSYYLRPRTLYHRMHPSAEHLIPRAHQARQLAAYRLDDLPADVWNSQPDYVLEYFEGAEYVDPTRTTEDRDWLDYYRHSMGDPTAVPGYVVRLRRWPLTGDQP